MKLVHPNIEVPINFNESFCYQLVIENATEFYARTQELIRQCNGEDGNFVLSDNGVLTIEKSCICMYDYFANMFQNKKINQTLQQIAEKVLTQKDFFKEFSIINQNMMKINEIIKKECNEHMVYNDYFTKEDFIKFSNYKLKQSFIFIENILNYIEFFIQHTKVKIVIFVQLSSVLTEKEIQTLCKQLHYMEINVLLVEPYQRYRLNFAQTVTIDNDLCVI